MATDPADLLAMANTTEETERLERQLEMIQQDFKVLKSASSFYALVSVC